MQNRFCYVRSGSRSIKAKGEVLRRLQELSARTPFDDRVNPTAELSDLNLGLIRSFLQEINSELTDESTKMPFADLCRQMHIAKGPNEVFKPINVGLLFFCNEPHRFFDRAWIEVVIRKDEAGRDFTEKYFKGPLHLQLREALAYIRTFTIEEKTEKVDGEAEAKRFHNFPFNAIEEALANAVYHKSYELGKPIEVQIWPDKIEILNFPGPVPPITAQILAENKRVVARDYRNRRVGDFLKELHLTEGRGTGIPTIYRAMKNNGSLPPVIETDDQCTYFLTVLPAREGFMGDQVSDYQSNQVSDQQSNYQSNQVNKKHLVILQRAHRPASRSELLDTLGLSNQTKNYQRYVEPLINHGFLTLSYPKNPRHRNQEYLITAKGKRILAHMSNQVIHYPSNQQSNYQSNQVNKKHLVILQQAHRPASRSELLDTLGLSNQTKNYQRYIEPLIDRDFLTLSYPENPRHRNQKYLTTPKGKQLLEEIKK
ncbi:MAG: Fic family protein [Bacteroidota bacterium]